MRKIIASGASKKRAVSICKIFKEIDSRLVDMAVNSSVGPITAYINQLKESSDALGLFLNGQKQGLKVPFKEKSHPYTKYIIPGMENSQISIVDWVPPTGKEGGVSKSHSHDKKGSEARVVMYIPIGNGKSLHIYTPEEPNKNIEVWDMNEMKGNQQEFPDEINITRQLSRKGPGSYTHQIGIWQYMQRYLENKNYDLSSLEGIDQNTLVDLSFNQEGGVSLNFYSDNMKNLPPTITRRLPRIDAINFSRSRL